MTYIDSIKYFASLAISLLIVSNSFGQRIFIRAGRIVDPVAGTTTQNQIIVVEGKKIVDIGPEIQIPRGAKVIDLSKSVIMPGLFDVHTHVCATVSKFADWLGVDYFDMVLLNPNGLSRYPRCSSCQGDA